MLNTLKTSIKGFCDFCFQIFKEPIEESVDQRGGPLLAAEEIKTIFGSIPEILEVHQKLLVSIDDKSFSL